MAMTIEMMTNQGGALMIDSITAETYGMEYVISVLGTYEASDAWADGLTFHVEGGGVQFSAFCSDLFHWGTADAEPILATDLGLLRRTAADLGEKHGPYLSDLFAARKRHMRPQEAYYRNLDPVLCDLFNAAGPERLADIPSERSS